ncbi:MAG: tetratricopeptide repeat protein [Rhodobacteraceae bacterium]|nr:tetratricopeptide repeat protein [Paracoccaceae bacterium]MCY4137126.1 tetratricopeptide repeat protein [Paracoccaceae bacterium]
MSLGVALRNRLFFVASVLLSMAAAPSGLAQSDGDAVWDRIKNCTDHVEVEIFIVEYPDNRHIEAARACLVESKETASETTGRNSGSLVMCERLISAGRLVAGEDGTAFACYREVLLRDPSNIEARLGLDRIADTIAGQAAIEVVKRNMSKASIYLMQLETVRPDDPRILEIRAAINGSARSMNELRPEDSIEAAMAVYGSGDFERALRSFRRLATMGNVKAQFYTGIMYHKGQGVPLDNVEAARWLRMAAQQGYTLAQFNLGYMHYSGLGVRKDLVESVRWFRMAAEQEDILSQFNLGLLYERGHGVPQDYAEAAKWYRRAAEQGDNVAQNSLGRLYECGRGVSQDYAKANRWYRRAAEQGHAGAKNRLDQLGEAGRNGRQSVCRMP